ncbi:hypothetical protein ABZ863_09080 [Saccharomonospora sp. NPDC046836]|uniref:hypothetical protein n=1 Tax=Saccharomonospora sp. NPDC046836 TaxID=3156921 RepID=UPI0033DD9C76
MTEIRRHPDYLGTLPFVSFSMHVVRFRQGEAQPLAREQFDAIFGVYVTEDPDLNFLHLQTPDGGDADIHVHFDGASTDAVHFHRPSSGQVMDLIAEFARLAEAVIMAPDCQYMVTNSNQIDHIPGEDLRELGAVIIQNGSDLAAAITDT